ncbi:Os10g0337100 [Oryza sativa Japonica Group]|uniref:Os10g0337100 protein n=1 Tax=Oryza sativa subsp. japonica TaxID=39947 RepID=A0A0P0XU06_ORYSJ|nr:Os10g0337100 [Oryza sativa Japonica Group]
MAHAIRPSRTRGARRFSSEDEVVAAAAACRGTTAVTTRWRLRPSPPPQFRRGSGGPCPQSGWIQRPQPLGSRIRWPRYEEKWHNNVGGA